MTVTYGFYNSVSSDRVYDATHISKMFDGLIADGVFMSIGSKLLVSIGTGMEVNVGSGRAWFDHSWTYNDGSLSLSITTAHATLNRIDTVVLETDSSTGVRANSIKVIDGTPASSPVPPTLTHTTYVNQYPLANIYVGASVTEIIAGNITNKVGTSDCPFVTGLLETVDVDELLVQWQSQFELWFEFLQNELDENQAANLQAQINEHDHSEVLNTQVVTGGIADNAVDDTKVGNRVPQLYRRQGYNADNWSFYSSGGSLSNYTPGAVRMQVGFKLISYDNSYPWAGTIAVTFPVAFSQVPLVFLTGFSTQNGSSPNIIALFVKSITATGFVAYASIVGVHDDTSFSWMAIGTE